MNKNKIKIIKYIKWPLILMVIFFILLVLFSLSYLFFLNKYDNKIFPGISIGNTNIERMTVAQAKKVIDKRIEQINQEGISLKYQGAEINLTPKISSLSGDISYEVIKFDSISSVNSAYLSGRDKLFFTNLKNQLNNLINGKKIPLKTTLVEEEIKKIIHENFEQFEIQSKNAELLIATSSGTEEINFSIQKEKMGKVINYNQAIEDIKNNIKNLSSNDILLKDKLEYPTIHQRDCLNIESQIKKILKELPIRLKYQENNWKIEKGDIVKWLELNKDGDEVIVNLSNQTIKKFLEKEISPEINKEPVDARFEIENNKVTQFESSQDGVEMEIDKTIDKIKNSLYNKTATKTIAIEIKEIKSKINVNNINDLGIKEIIGTGHSNFSGSPANRIHNITVGSQKLNGLLIKPGEEFSLVTSLGNIDAENN
ncbi:peptidoglycan binding domain-containing protein, partial [bacterium]|nr:peptidoglycan binding domain-containing protein [bacterium]